MFDSRVSSDSSKRRVRSRVLSGLVVGVVAASVGISTVRRTFHGGSSIDADSTDLHTHRSKSHHHHTKAKTSVESNSGVASTVAEGGFPGATPNHPTNSIVGSSSSEDDDNSMATTTTSTTYSHGHTLGGLKSVESSNNDDDDDDDEGRSSASHSSRGHHGGKGSSKGSSRSTASGEDESASSVDDSTNAGESLGWGSDGNEPTDEMNDGDSSSMSGGQDAEYEDAEEEANGGGNAAGAGISAGANVNSTLNGGSAGHTGVGDDDGGLLGNWTTAFNGTSKGTGTDKHSRCKLFKRTIASTHAQADAAWLFANVGMRNVLNETYSNRKAECASRQLLSTLGGWGMHYFTSHVTEEGDIPVSAWVDEWNELHAASLADGTWNTWMAQSVTFYTPFLSPFIKRWDDGSVRWQGRRYVSELDGETLYSAFVAVPHSGHMIELVSDNLHPKYSRLFGHLTDDMCPDAVRVNRTVADMSVYWGFLGGEEVNEITQLPDVLVVQVTMPTDNIWSLPRYLKEYVATSMPSQSEAVGGGAPCEFATLGIPKCGEEVDGDVDEAECSDEMLWTVDVKLVRNRNARHGNYSVGDFEEYVDGVHKANLGCNEGWDRYLDNHLGVWCSRPEFLDRIGPKMCETGVGFHAHRGSDDFIGSIWSAGVGSLGVEFHGSFDGSFFNRSELSVIDYCAKTSTGSCAHHKC